VGIDIGGTFTDLAAVDEAGKITIAKTSSTPMDPSVGLLEGLTVLATELGLSRSELLSETERIVHGTTVATNALLEGKGAKVALLTTAGHRDVIEMREGMKDDRYNVRMAPPTPLVPRKRRIGVLERMRFDGIVSTPLTAPSLTAAVEAAAALDVDAIAVCYLHSYTNPTHEIETAKALAVALPDTYVSLSSEVLPQIKEYERVWTTVVNAYVGPVLSSYLSRLSDQLRGAGYHGEVLIMHSHGGLASIAESSRLAAGAVLSGPAGGVAAARHIAELIGEGNLITFDMGGTSTDIALLVDGDAQLTSEKQVGLARVSLPTLDIHTLGAGGGSLANVVGSILHVGPESAGADPGPACYRRGGHTATVTDANVVLGYLGADSFLGGRMKLDADAASAALAALGSKLGVDTVQAADGVVKVVNTAMAEGIRIVSVRRGVDPRGFALVAFGGAAGLHVTEVARLLQINRVVVPNVASVLSAWGMLASDLRFELVRSHVSEASTATAAGLRELLVRMEDDGRQRLEGFAGEVVVQRSLDMRYGEQIFEVSVAIDDIDIASEDLMDAVVARFHKRHDDLYAYNAPGQDVVIVNVRTTVIAKLPRFTAGPLVNAESGDATTGHRPVFIDGWQNVPVYQLDSLRPATVVDGPAVFESPTTTVLIRRGEHATINEFGWLDIWLDT
jgi:N-methylhydantoinase A